MAGATSKQSPPVHVTAGPSKAASSKGSLPPPPPARWPAQPRSSGRGHRHNPVAGVSFAPDGSYFPRQERREAAQSVVAKERLRVETFGHQQELLAQSSQYQHSLQLQAQQHQQKKVSPLLVVPFNTSTARWRWQRKF